MAATQKPASLSAMRDERSGSIKSRATTYAVSVSVLGSPVMCGTIEAADAATARAEWEAKFWRDPGELRAAIPTMDALNAKHASQFADLMDATRDDGRRFGIEVVARKSRSKAEGR